MGAHGYWVGRKVTTSQRASILDGTTEFCAGGNQNAGSTLVSNSYRTQPVLGTYRGVTVGTASAEITGTGKGSSDCGI